MRPVKVIPTSPAINAALTAKSPAAPRPLPADTPDATFTRWLLDRQLHTLSVTVEDAASLIAAAPVADSPMGCAWVEATRTSIDQANADQWRTYDVVDIEDIDTPHIAALDALCERLEATSPLLAPVADAVGVLSPDPGMTLTRVRYLHAAVRSAALPVDLPRDNDAAEVRHLREQLTAEPDPGRRAHLQSVIDSHDYSPSFAAPIPWDHIHLLAPGTKSAVARLVTALYGALPAGADGGESRR